MAEVLKQGQQAGLRRVTRTDAWYFLPADLRHLATGLAEAPKAADGQDPVPVIADFSKALKARGIKLVVLPVPEKARIRADRLFGAAAAGSAPQMAALEAASGRYIKRLRDQGVEVFDPSELFRKWLGEGADPVYCRSDTHYTPRTCERLAAALVADYGQALVKSPDATAGQPVAGAAGSLVIEGDLADKGEKEELQYKVVKRPGQGGVYQPDDASPVLLMGDSHCLIFHGGGDMHAEGAGLFDFLTVGLGAPPSLIAVRGSGATSARVELFRKTKRVPGYLGGKKLVIWCFAAREFTQSEGWKKVPLP